MGCNYLPLPLILASVTTLLICELFLLNIIFDYSSLQMSFLVSALIHLPRICFRYRIFFRILGSICWHRNPLYWVYIPNRHNLQRCFRLCDQLSLRCLMPWIDTSLCLLAHFFLANPLDMSWSVSLTLCRMHHIYSTVFYYLSIWLYFHHLNCFNECLRNIDGIHIVWH